MTFLTFVYLGLLILIWRLSAWIVPGVMLAAAAKKFKEVIKDGGSSTKTGA